MLDLQGGRYNVSDRINDRKLSDGNAYVSFSGETAEPRPGLSSGHMPNSFSLPFNNLRTSPSNTTPPYQTILPPHKLQEALLKALGDDESKLREVLDGKRNVVNSCGSGMTAAVIWLALQELKVDSSIYDEVRKRMG